MSGGKKSKIVYTLSWVKEHCDIMRLALCWVAGFFSFFLPHSFSSSSPPPSVILNLTSSPATRGPRSSYVGPCLADPSFAGVARLRDKYVGRPSPEATRVIGDAPSYEPLICAIETSPQEEMSVCGRNRNSLPVGNPLFGNLSPILKWWPLLKCMFAVQRCPQLSGVESRPCQCHHWLAT